MGFGEGCAQLGVQVVCPWDTQPAEPPESRGKQGVFNVPNWSQPSCAEPCTSRAPRSCGAGQGVRVARPGQRCLRPGSLCARFVSKPEFGESNYCVLRLQRGGSLSLQRAEEVPERETTGGHWSVKLGVICKRSQPNKLFTLSFGSQLERLSAEGNKHEKGERGETISSAY